MTKYFLSFLIIFLLGQKISSQNIIFAYVKDNQGKPIEDAEVSISSISRFTKTDKVGYFQLKEIPKGEYELSVFKPNYIILNKFITVSEEKRVNLGDIMLEFSPASTDMGVISLTDEELGDDENSAQSNIGLLQASRDAFSRAAAYELGSYWFRPRGADNRYNDVLFNGIPFSKQDNGRIDFSNWGGLNDVTRYPQEIAENINPSENTFGNLRGVTYYNTRASSYRRGTSLAYSFTNRSYFHRLMLTHSTGLSPRGWALTVSGSRRWADDGIIDGTYQDRYAFFLSLEKKLSPSHSLNVTIFGAPTRRASNSPNTQETYDLAGKNYNSYWGWQDGERRNERIRKVFEPVIQFAHYWKIGTKSNLNTTLSYQKGKDSRSRLDWFHANSPSPTYYRYLPSYNVFSKDEWESNKQINWTQLYFANSNTGDYGTGIRGNRAAYYLVEDINEDKTFNISSHFNTKIKDNWKLNLNFNYQNLHSDNFREVGDLLGANFALNLDGFNGDRKFNIDNPSAIVKEGDRTLYSYLLNREIYKLNASTEIDLTKWNVIVSAFASHSKTHRDGDYRHHLYLNESKGKSAQFNSFDLGIKARITYKINGKNFIAYNGAYFTLVPTFNEIFTNPRVNNFLTPNLKSEIINSNDLSFIHRGQTFKIRATGYITDIKNATEISRYYAQGIAGDAFVAETLNGIKKRYLGAELGVEYKILPTLTAIAVASYGKFTYENNPDVYYSADDPNIVLGTTYLGRANIKDYYVAGTPQQGYSLGLRYSSPQFWWIGASGNYLASNYLDFSALPRTANFYTDPTTGDNYSGVTQEDVNVLLKQTKFEDQFMLNANVGKSFLFGKYRMGISLTVNNILNNRDYVTGGFEQGRLSNYPDALEESQRAIPIFGPKLWYDRGISYFANIYVRF